MKSRPWPIVILALLNILAPVYNIAFSSYLSGGPVPLYLKALFAQAKWYEVGLFLLAQPLAGVSIYLTQLWSYPVFIVLTLATVIANYLSYRTATDLFPLRVLIASFIVNVGLVSYFLIPQVRIVFFNRRVRWWESKPRFTLEIPCRVVVGPNDKRSCALHNISEGGVYLTPQGRLGARKTVQLQFNFMGRDYDFECKVAHRRRSGKVQGYGLQFVHNADSLEIAQNLARGLDYLGCASNRNPIPIKDSFVFWLTTLLKTGRGWVPEVQLPDARPKNKD